MVGTSTQTEPKAVAIPYQFRPIVIGLGHRAHQGKGTLAKYMKEWCHFSGDDCRIYSFAHALKVEFYGLLFKPYHEFWKLAETFDLAHDLLSDLLEDLPFGLSKKDRFRWVEERKNKLRPWLQVFGTEYWRKKDAFHWIRIVAKTIEEERPDFAIIEDMRFFNEALWVKECGGVTVHVKREGYIHPLDFVHVSEAELDDFAYDVTVLNEENNFAGVRTNADRLMEHIIESRGRAATFIGSSGVIDEEVRQFFSFSEVGGEQNDA